MLTLLAPQVLALEIQVTDKGEILFYENGVLGESTTTSNTDSVQPVKIVPATAQQSVRINIDQDGVNVQLRDKASGPVLYKQALDEDNQSFTDAEEIEAGRLQMRFPAGQTDAQSDKAEKQAELKDQKAEMSEEKKAYLEQLKLERKERVKEMVEIRNRVQDGGGQALELRSRNVAAKLQGASFELNSETNEVILTTPSGQEHILQHLPDQALDRMKKLGALDQFAQVDEIELATTADGEILYKAKASKTKKLLGIFNRQVDIEVVVDDQTGDVTENEVPAESGFARFLDRLSF